MICGALRAIVGTLRTASPIAIHEGPIIEKKGCAVGPRVAATCRSSGSAAPASREKL